MFNVFTDGIYGLAAAGRPAPALELIERPAPKRRYTTPLLFIHGAYAGAWCWDEHFLDYFADRGYDSYAVSLRGHGGSEGGEWLHSYGVSDYVDDVSRIVERLGCAPAMIGHSMGGMVMQKYLERAALPAAVLLASVPPMGLALPTLELMMGDPWLFVQVSVAHSWNPQTVDFNSARRAIFSDDVSEIELARYADKFQSESQRAIWDMTMADLPQRWRMQLPPLLVLGAEHDSLFSPAMVQQTAAAYGVEPEIFPNMAHAMMLERGWNQVAKRMADWLDEQAL